MLILRVLSLLCLFTANIQASSHWMVTETGLIRSKEESPFLLAEPFDLLSFLNQEIRWQNIFNIYDDLILRQKLINSLWADLEEQSDLTSHAEANEHCKITGELQNIDWYSVIVEDGKSVGIAEREFMLYAIEEFGSTEVPDCKKISSLTFSMATFEHLESMIYRGYLNATPETTLPEVFSSVRTIDQYGHWLSEVLRRNTTSWLHYNLAAIYWRVKGHAPKALECSRRAVHYAPRHYKTIPLLCMGAILHRAKRTEDALIVLGASVDHAPKLALAHFAIGETYAVAGDFNSSIKHLNISMELRNGSKAVSRFLNAVLCHRDLFLKMEYAQRTLNKLGTELEEYRQLETEWFKIHTAFLKTMKHSKEYSYKNVEQNIIKMEEITQLQIKELRKDRDRNNLIQYLADTPQYSENWSKGVHTIAIGFDLEKAVKRTVKQTGPPNLTGYNSHMGRNKTEIAKEFGPMLSFLDMFPEPIKFPDKRQKESDIEADSKITSMHGIPLSEHLEQPMLKQEDGKVLYPPNLKVSRHKQDFDIDSEWPSNEFCQEAKRDFPDSIDGIYPVFMPFEHKGLSVQSLLTDKVGVPALEEHELPWHPPLCPTDKDTSLYTNKKGIKVPATEAVAIEYLRFKLLTYVSQEHYDVIENRQEAEIGQRIHTAMHKKLASKWILHTIASLYWRVRGNNANALNCLLSAQRSVDVKHQDVVLVSLASVLLEMGLWDDAMHTADEAYRINSYEPPTNFLLAQLHMVKKQQKAKFFHLKQALRVEPQYMRGRARSLLNCWACIAKQVNTLRDLGVLSADIDGDKDICAETEAGVSMVCERDGTNCRLATTHCSPGTTKESSTLVRMLEDKEDLPQPLFSHRVLEATFSRVVSSRPSERHDRAGHLKSYDAMMRPVAEQMALCKSHGCGLTPEALDIKREECEYNLFELDYWLQYVSFQVELSDTLSTISPDVASMTPSHKRVPECRVPVDSASDFFLSRILTVGTDDWGALLALMQHITDLFDQHDYGLLGAKLAKYIDTHAGSWWGALAASWWCGAIGRGVCAVKCLAVAHSLAPPQLAHVTLRPLIALLHLQNKHRDATDIAYLSFYMAPKSKTEAFLVGISHHYNQEPEDAIWMYRFALSKDYMHVPATACMHRAICHIAFGEEQIKKPHQTPT